MPGDTIPLRDVISHHKNISRSILKESKYYLYDTGAVENGFGAKLENTVACALIRELHFLEDTTGSRVALHFLRNKEKQEVDFLVVVDNKPVTMIEVKTADDSFSPSLFRFHKFLPTATPVQIVHKLRRSKTRGAVNMVPVHEFLDNLKFSG